MSGIALAIEAGLILIPLTLKTALGFLFAVVIVFDPDLWPLAIPVFAGAAALGFLWLLTRTFLESGRESLVLLPDLFWATPIVVAVISVGATVAQLTHRLPAGKWGEVLSMFIYGLAAVIPLIHLASEKWLRSSASPEDARME